MDKNEENGQRGKWSTVNISTTLMPNNPCLSRIFSTYSVHLITDNCNGRGEFARTDGDGILQAKIVAGLQKKVVQSETRANST